MYLQISVNVKNLVDPRKAAPVLDSGRPVYTLLALFNGCEISSMCASNCYDYQFANGTVLAELGMEDQALDPAE
jgi:hypothetical protein